MEITRYSVQDSRLIPWIKFFWEFEAQGQDIFHKLLPTESIDILVNIGEPITYVVGSHRIFAPKIHINGLRSQHSFIQQSGDIHIFGISFTPYGLYPFLHLSMKTIKDEVVDLSSLSHRLANGFAEAVTHTTNRVERIEQTLLQELTADESFIEKSDLLRRFIYADEPSNIQSFCTENGLHIKTFERLCIQYTGYPPSTLSRIHRFQSASNQIVHQKPDNLAAVAYSNSYADQAHLIREFKSFSGEAPRSFTQKKISVKENVKYRYL